MQNPGAPRLRESKREMKRRVKLVGGHVLVAESLPAPRSLTTEASANGLNAGSPFITPRSSPLARSPSRWRARAVHQRVWEACMHSPFVAGGRDERRRQEPPITHSSGPIMQFQPHFVCARARTCRRAAARAEQVQRADSRVGL